MVEPCPVRSCNNTDGPRLSAAPGRVGALICEDALGFADMMAQPAVVI
jgi:hypothetical protein